MRQECAHHSTCSRLTHGKSSWAAHTGHAPATSGTLASSPGSWFRSMQSRGNGVGHKGISLKLLGCPGSGPWRLDVSLCRTQTSGKCADQREGGMGGACSKSTERVAVEGGIQAHNSDLGSGVASEMPMCICRSALTLLCFRENPRDHTFGLHLYGPPLSLPASPASAGLSLL